MRRILVFLALWMAGHAAAAGIADLSNADAVSGLRGALNEGSLAAVAKLGVENGFFGNPKVRIPLPPSLQRVEGAMRAFGMRRQADELVLTMNRAAEAAVPEAKQLLVDAVKKMSVQDAKGILTGGDTAATEYFKRTTQKDQSARRPVPHDRRAGESPAQEPGRRHQRHRQARVRHPALAFSHLRRPSVAGRVLSERPPPARFSLRKGPGPPLVNSPARSWT
jgi:hypothetical protein